MLWLVCTVHKTSLQILARNFQANIPQSTVKWMEQHVWNTRVMQCYNATMKVPGAMLQARCAQMLCQRQAELVPARKARLEAEFGFCPVRGGVYDSVLRIEHLCLMTSDCPVNAAC